MCGYTCLCIFWYTFLCTLLQISFLFIALFSMSFVGKFTPMIDGLFHSLRAYASSYHPAPLRISVSVFGCLPCVWLLDFPALLLSVQTQNTFIFLRSSTQPWNDFFSHFDSARPVFFFSHHCHRYFLLIKALTYISFFFSPIPGPKEPCLLLMAILFLLGFTEFHLLPVRTMLISKLTNGKRKNFDCFSDWPSRDRINLNC